MPVLSVYTVVGSHMGGIYPALMTGYDDAGRLSLERTGVLVESLVKAGVHGLFVGGTAGEGPAQTADERRSVITHVADQLRGEIPFIAHVGGMSFHETVELGRHAIAHGAQAVAAIPPLYYDLRLEDLTSYFVKLHKAIDAPVMIYHIPALSHRQLPTAWYEPLVADGVVSGVKYSADNLGEIQRLIEQGAPSGFALYSGSDPLCLAARLVGSAGAVGVSINALPRLFVTLWENGHAQDVSEAMAAQRLINRFVDRMFRHNFVAYLRVVLGLQGIDLGGNRPPLPDLAPGEAEAIRSGLREDEELSAALGLS